MVRTIFLWSARDDEDPYDDLDELGDDLPLPRAFKIMKRSKNKILNLRRSLNRDVRLFGRKSMFIDLLRLF
ncbi:hypothetical protein H5410_035549 [Solanum commersonii]|uniref:Uncharacterized protein n=1 Tax=Solanum commersonii TaxID=4109 RepID=A0A9J5Y272_SOLCO|nr:hypothetical protein H5410_035549 [Solanum commersonii]